MESRHYLHPIIGIAILFLSISGVQASTVVHDDFQIVDEYTLSKKEFDVFQPGTYKADLVDFEFPAAFSFLTLGIEQDLTPLGFRFGTGSFTFNVTTPGTLTALLSAMPGAGGVGSYALQITAIPIPASFLLFFSGLIGLAVVGRRNNSPEML